MSSQLNKRIFFLRLNTGIIPGGAKLYRVVQNSLGTTGDVLI
jgi:hypothetical protein